MLPYQLTFCPRNKFKNLTVGIIRTHLNIENMTEEQKTHTQQSGQELHRAGNEPPTTKDLLFRIMESGGATCEDLGDNRYGFFYEKEHFMVALDDSMVIKIVDYNWHSVSRWDVEAITELQSKINHFNMYAMPKMVYAYDDDDDTFNISTILTVPLTEKINAINDYFVAMLDRVLQSHEFILGKDYKKEDGDAQQEEEGGEEND